MAQSRLSAAGDEGIGTRPGDLGAWNKLQLGWLDYTAIKANESRTIELGPQEYNTAKPQPAQPVFNDKGNYFFKEVPNAGVKLPAVGVKIRVAQQSGTSMTIVVN